MNGSKQSGKIFLSSLISLGLLVSVPSSAEVGGQPVATEGPMIFDVMSFNGKPDLGLSQEISFIYEWEATLRDEGAELTAAGSDQKPSSYTIEADSLRRSVQQRAGFKYIVVDIESLTISEDPIAIQYVEIMKEAVPDSKHAWWNAGPPNAGTQFLDRWRAKSDARAALVEANDFCILGSYFKSSDNTVDTWAARHVPRIPEARRLCGTKPLFVTIAPHYFDEGKPWPFVSSKILGEAMDMLADHQVDGIALWSFEGTGKLKNWNENWDWVRVVRARTGPDGRYRKPGSAPAAPHLEVLETDEELPE